MHLKVVRVYFLIGFQVKKQTSFEMAKNVNQTGFNRLSIYGVFPTSKWIGNIGPGNYKFVAGCNNNALLIEGPINWF